MLTHTGLNPCFSICSTCRHAEILFSISKCTETRLIVDSSVWTVLTSRITQKPGLCVLPRFRTYGCLPPYYIHTAPIRAVYNNVLSFLCIHRYSGEVMTEYALLSYTVNWSKPSLSFETHKSLQGSFAIGIGMSSLLQDRSVFSGTELQQGLPLFAVLCSVGTHFTRIPYAA